MSRPARRRLDAELVERGLATSRSHAADLVATGRVLVSGSRAERPARLVARNDPVEVLEPPPRFVGRGGLKLEAALDRFDIRVDGRRAIDVGSSTGGFTDCLRQRGAAPVVAVDVGRAQLHERMRRDPVVEVHERTTVRGLDPATIGGPAPLVVADLSFISLRTVAADLVTLVDRAGDLVVLVKPQFEAGRLEASRGAGVIRDPAIWRRVLLDVIAAFAELGTAMMGAMASPITGAEGNVEFFLHLRPGPGAVLIGAGAEQLVDSAISAAPTGVI